MTTNEKAAAVLDTPAAAPDHTTHQAAIVGPAHDPRKFAQLQERAGRAGYALMQVRGGFMLLRGATSHHAEDLCAIAVLLARGCAAEVSL